MGIFTTNLKIATVTIAFVVVLSSCSSETAGTSKACERAAIAQAAAEERWGEILEEHVRADRELEADPSSVTATAAHDDSAAFLVGARVDVILAEANTRKNCG